MIKDAKHTHVKFLSVRSRGVVWIEKMNKSVRIIAEIPLLYTRDLSTIND